MYTRGFNEAVSNNLEKDRFSLKVRKLNEKGEYLQKRDVMVVCDLSAPCLSYLKTIDKQIMENYDKFKSVTWRRLLFRSELIPNVQLIEIYYHVQLRGKKLPYVIVFDGEDP